MDEEFIEYIKGILKDPTEFNDFVDYAERNKVLTDNEMLEAMLFGLNDKTKAKADNILSEWRKEKLIIDMAGIR